MLFDLPDQPTLYAALLARDERYDGQAFVCVSSTGVFCRLTCPARKPKPENCTFFPTIGECIEAGYRACKRCHPLQAAASADPTIGALLHALDERPDLRWSEEHVERLGYDPSTVRRSFRRQFGMTFLEMARQRRLREGFETLAGGGKVIEAQQEASFESPSAFRAAFARLLGCAPGDLRTDSLLKATWVPTPLGDMIAVSSSQHLHLLEFVDRKGEDIEACEAAGITPHVPRPHRGINVGSGLFLKERFRYDPAADVYHCPGGQVLDTRYSSVTRGHVTTQYSNPAACAGCGLKAQCTKGRWRRVNRWEKEEIIDRMAERLAKRPDILVIRRSTVEHPFGTIKQSMNQGAFLMRGLEKVRAEFSLTALAYNIRRAITLIGVPGLIQAARA